MALSIAVVEDDPTLSMLLRYNLEAAGYAVEALFRGDEAKRRLGSAPLPDLILLDWLLPGMSGIEVLRHIRSSHGGRSLPVVMLTCNCDVENRNRAYRLGATDFVAKPFSLRSLISRIDALLDPKLACGKTARPISAGGKGSR